MGPQVPPAPVSVRGGTGGIAARTAEIEAAARRFASAATETLGTAFGLHGFLVHPVLLESALFDPIGFGTVEADLLDALDGPRGLTWLGSSCGLLAGALQAASVAYDAVDTLGTVFGDGLTGLARLPIAVAHGQAALISGADPAEAAQVAIAADPQAADLVVNALGLPGLIAGTARSLPDGRSVVRRLGVDAAGVAARPPRKLTDVVLGLSRRDHDPRPGAVDVRILTRQDGSRRAIVDITGTRTFDPGPTSDITSLTTNGRALTGQQTAYEQGVLAAMHDAGVRPGDKVMLVGHSEGGMVAVNAARDAVRTGRFTVTHVVTAGSPLGLTAGRLPRQVQLLALENAKDVVPHLDGRANPDRPNVTTASSSHGDGTIVGDHEIDRAYLPVAADVQASPATSIRDFLGSADGYLDAEHVTTHTYQVTRAYK